jgi:O-antigen ligase
MLSDSKRYSILDSANFFAILLFLFVMDFFDPKLSVVDFTKSDVELSLASTSSSNIYNQIFWLFLFLFSVFVFFKKRNDIRLYLFISFPLIICVSYLFVSALWSVDVFISFKRAVLQVFLISSVAALVMKAKNIEDIFISYFIASIIIVFFDLVSFVFGSAFDEFGYYRGIHGNKNAVGPMAVLTIFVSYALLYNKNRSLIFKFFCVFSLIVWLVFLLLSFSKTSIALLVVVPALLISFRFFSALFRANLFDVLIVIFVFLLAVMYLIYLVDSSGDQGFYNYYLSEGSLTGRGYIWDFLLGLLDASPLFGYGYGGVWGVGYSSLNIKHGSGFILLLNQAHNGYLDICLQLGFFGLLFFVFMNRNFFINSSALMISKLTKLSWCIVVFLLIHNMTESSIFRGYSYVWVMGLVAYFYTYRMKVEAIKYD